LHLEKLHAIFDIEPTLETLQAEGLSGDVVQRPK
jgi:hypothetical protein